MSDKLSFSIREVIQKTGIGRTKIFAEIRAGRLRARKLGRRTIIAAADLEHWISQLPLIRPVRLTDGADSEERRD